MSDNQTTIFDKIINKEIPSKVVYQDDFVLAFRDISPQAPTHILIIPKKKDGLSMLEKAQQKHQQILGKMMVTAAKIAKQQNLVEGYRIVVNNGKHGGQEVQHIHIHLLGGKQLSWPPGC